MHRFALILDQEGGSRKIEEEEIEVFLKSEDRNEVLWVDIEDPTPIDTARLRELFGFHPLALEDCLKDHQRPKVEHYGEVMFFVCYQVGLEQERVRLVSRELDLFMSARFLVTVHQGELGVSEILERYSNSALCGSKGLFYFLMDQVVDGYFPVVDFLSDRLERLEEQIFSSPEERTIQRVFRIRKELSRLRRILIPLRDAFVPLVRQDLGPQLGLHLQDVYDHLTRLAESIDTQRDIVTGLVDIYLSGIANRTNEVMKRLTSIAAILMSITFIAAIYGMNFRYMPELEQRYGYPTALVSMALVALLQILYFKRKRYF
ncbi:MAG TPA: magnesium and cobalt transport protein CorA [Cyanobacteria bacterium UBA8530]|nr:magnesium and cobalt transport protein CorA [Cyanobacteria bacterium UBA8530]